MVGDRLSQRITDLYEHIEKIRMLNLSEPGNSAQAISPVLEVLQSSLEELFAAEEELYQQNDELIEASQERERHLKEIEYSNQILKCDLGPTRCNFQSPPSMGSVFPQWDIKLETLGRLACIIADKARTDEALKTSEERRRLAQDAAKAGTWEWDLRTNENFWSEELWGLYGLEPHICKPTYEAWLKTVHPDDRYSAQKAVLEASEHGTELNAEWRVMDNHGQERWLMSRGRPVMDASGQIVRYIGIVMDITDHNITGHKRAEMELKKYQDHLKEMVLERTGKLEAANAKLQAEVMERKQAKGDLQESEKHYRALFENMTEGFF